MAEKSVWKRFGAYQDQGLNTCLWCGEPLQSEPRFYFDGKRESSMFCGHRCGHQFAESVARIGFRLVAATTVCIGTE